MSHPPHSQFLQLNHSLLQIVTHAAALETPFGFSVCAHAYLGWHLVEMKRRGRTKQIHLVLQHISVISVVGLRGAVQVAQIERGKKKKKETLCCLVHMYEVRRS